MAHRTSAAQDAWRVLRNSPVAASVVGRHLAQGAAHTTDVSRRILPSLLTRPLPRPRTGTADSSTTTRSSALDAAVALHRAGELSEALRLARSAGGVRGGLLSRYLAGELSLLEPHNRPLEPRPTQSQPSERRPLGPGRRSTTGTPGAAAPVRVLHLVTNALPEVVAGYTVRTQGIATAQRAAGSDAHVATRLGFPVSKGHLRARAYTEVDGVPHHRSLAPVPLRGDVALARDVARTSRLVERLRPDVLHAHSNHVNGQVALTVGRRLGIPVVYEVRGFIEETRRSHDGEGRRSELWRLTREAESWCMAEADAVVTLSRSMRAELLSRGVPPDAVTVCPNAVDRSWLDRPSGTLPAPHGFPPLADGTVVVGVVGTLNPYEGVDVLIRAVAMVPRLHLVVVGDGPARAELERLAGGQPVTFVGRVPVAEVPRWHSAIDVYCLPRLDLPVTRLVPPLKPVEAMAAGRPVVASDLPPLAELVRDGETGLLVPPGDVDALARALDRLARDAELRRKLGAAGRAEVAMTRTWTTVAEQDAELYATLVERARRRAWEPARPEEGATA